MIDARNDLEQPKADMDEAFPKQKFPHLTERDCIARGRVVRHPHFDQRALQRGVGIDDAYEVLGKGTVSEARYKKGAVPPDCWWYKMEDQVDGATISVVFYFAKDGEQPVLVLYTIIKP